jgi:hypothetical protein
MKRFIVKYIGGASTINKPTDNYLLDLEESGIKLWQIFSKTVTIGWESINKISADTSGQVSRGLSGKGAVAGLVLFGPLGGLIGAGLGSSKSILFVSIEYKDEENEINTLVLQTKQAHEIANILNNERKIYYKNNNIPLTKESSTNPSNNLDQIEKLAELKDKKIISEKEFEEKKKQLLGIQ